MPRCQQAWCDLWQLRPLGDILGLQAFDKDRMALGTYDLGVVGFLLTSGLGDTGVSWHIPQV